MGLFSSTKKTYVSSTVYNMAGPILDRQNYLKTTVTTELFRNGGSKDLGNNISNHQLNGPYMGHRGFLRWAKKHYPEGTMSGDISNKRNISAERLKRFIPVPAGKVLFVQGAQVDSGDYIYWVEKYLLETKPERFDEDWVCDIGTNTNDVTISYPDGTSEVITLTDYDPAKDYVFAYYMLVDEDAISTVGAQSVFIYELGSGNFALDLLDVNQASDPEFYPVIPLRIDNKSIRHANYAEVFPTFEKAYKKAVGGKINELLDNIEDNEGIGDIDFAYMVHGVPLNTQEKEGKKYLYEFLRNLESYQNRNADPADNWAGQINSTFQTYLSDKLAWENDQVNGGVLQGTPMPENKIRELPDISVIKIHTPNEAQLGLRFNISWSAIHESIGTGLGKPDAEVGDIWWDTSPSNIEQAGLPLQTGGLGSSLGSTISNVSQWEVNRLFWQESATNFRWLDIKGLVHENNIYNGKSVKLSVQEALENLDESGFVVPLHEPTLKKMRLTDRNELIGSSRLLVFNAYQVVTTKWYESGIFRIIVMIVVVVVVALVFPPAAPGLLGTNLAVGTAIGMTGTAAIVAGAVANAVAAMLLTEIIMRGSVALFGPKWGAVVGTILTVVTFSMQSGGFDLNKGTSLNWADMMKPDNLLKLTDAVTGTIEGWARGEMGEIQGDMDQAAKDYEKRAKEIQEKTNELLGSSGVDLNPLMFMEMQDSSLSTSEPRSVFLTRTLLTGSGIANLSFAMIEHYAELTLQLPGPNE